VARVPPPRLTGAQVVAMISKNLPTNPLAGRTAAAIMTLPHMGLHTGPDEGQSYDRRGGNRRGNKEASGGYGYKRLVFFSFSRERM